MNQEVLREMQGLYGPYSMHERVVQKIWLRRDFEHAALRLCDGRGLEIRSGGEWNLLGGPDFRGARLMVDGRPVSGDVEVHLHAADWRRHGHADDPAYREVVLHVVLFPPAWHERPALDSSGAELPTLVLLPYLNRGLEEYVADDTLERLTDRDLVERLAELGDLAPEARHELLRAHALRRWENKVAYARVRLGRLGWIDACHHSALEILGYRRNRTPMLAIATRFPLAAWAAGLDAAAVFDDGGLVWETHGIRPANQPAARLRQYGRWAAARPDWPSRLRTLWPGDVRSDGTGGVKDVRKRQGFPARRSAIVDEVLGHALSGPRVDTLVCDGFLPLLAAEAGGGPEWWFSWFAGDVPDEVRRALAAFGVCGSAKSPLCHGWAQGFLGWLAERGCRASR